LIFFPNKLLQIFDLPQFIFQLLGHNEKKQIGLTKGVDYDKVFILLDREQGFLLHTHHNQGTQLIYQPPKIPLGSFFGFVLFLFLLLL